MLQTWDWKSGKNSSIATWLLLMAPDNESTNAITSSIITGIITGITSSIITGENTLFSAYHWFPNVVQLI